MLHLVADPRNSTTARSCDRAVVVWPLVRCLAPATPGFLLPVGSIPYLDTLPDLKGSFTKVNSSSKKPVEDQVTLGQVHVHRLAVFRPPRGMENG